MIVKLPMLSEIQSPNPLTPRSVPLRWTCFVPMRCLPSLLGKYDNKAIYESSPKGVRYALWERHSDFYHTRAAHRSWRDVRFPKMSGMGPVNWLYCRYLHPNVCSRVGLEVNFNVHHMKYALHFALCFFGQPPSISLWITIQNNPFKASDDSIETRLPN